MIWTLLAFLVAFFVLRKYAWPAITEALDKRQRAIEESIDDGRAHARGGRSELLEEYRERLREARAQADEIVARARKAGEVHERETRRGGQAPARGAARADPPRHRGRDAPRDPGDPQRGRRPHDPGHREGDPQDARRGRPEAPRRGGARASSTSQLARRGAHGTRPWRRSPRSTRARCSRSPQEHDKLDVVREQLGAVRRRAAREPRAADVLLLAVLLDRGEEGGPATRRSTAPTRPS